MEQIELKIKSGIDGSIQPSIFIPAKGKHRPMIVGLHTWSYDRFNPISLMLPYAEKYDFNLLCPEFRGPNLVNNPHREDACASLLARGDIKDAIDACIDEYDVDSDNIFLIGMSGGGHMALMMAGYCPEYFKAVSAIVPICDLSLWHDQNKNYSGHVAACCSSSRAIMLERSPISHVDKIAQANLKIFHGKYDPVVPVSQSISFYNRLIEMHPDARVYLDIFDGKHEIDMESVMHWVMTQYKKQSNQKVTG